MKSEAQEGKVDSRLIEPYSLRRTNSGALLLHAIRHQDGQPRTYRVDRILGASATSTRFVPRYAIELTASGPQVRVEITERVARTADGDRV